MPRLSLTVPLASALALACVPQGADDPFQETLQGTWSSCVSDGSSDRAERLTFTGDALEWTVATYATADASCGGAESIVSRLAAAFALGDFIDATLEGVAVSARGLDVMDGTRTFYTTVWVDEAAKPRALYLGVADPALGRDMSSGAKRPIVLGADPLAQR